MSQVGIYRYKLTPTTDQTVTFYIQTPAGQLEYPQSVKVRDYCDSEILLKYLDSNGQYKLFLYSQSYFATRISIGSTYTIAAGETINFKISVIKAGLSGIRANLT